MHKPECHTDDQSRCLVGLWVPHREPVSSVSTAINIWRRV